jgi:hypothetical protein
VYIRYPRINRVINAPTTYPEYVLVSKVFDVTNKIDAFISNDFIRIQKCSGIYKDFVRISHRCIKTL